jgi:hypothetical protein
MTQIQTQASLTASAPHTPTNVSNHDTQVNQSLSYSAAPRAFEPSDSYIAQHAGSASSSPHSSRARSPVFVYSAVHSPDKELHSFSGVPDVSAPSPGSSSRRPPSPHTPPALAYTSPVVLVLPSSDREPPASPATLRSLPAGRKKPPASCPATPPPLPPLVVDTCTSPGTITSLHSSNASFISPSHVRQQHHLHASPGRAFVHRDKSDKSEQRKRGSVSSDSDDSNSGRFKLGVSAGHFGHGCLDTRNDKWRSHEDRHVSWLDHCAPEMNAVGCETSSVYLGHAACGTSSTEHCSQQNATNSGHHDIQVCGSSFGEGSNGASRDSSPHVRSNSHSPQHTPTRGDRSSHVVRVHTERHTVRYVQEGRSSSPAHVAPRIADKRDVEMTEMRASSRRTSTSAGLLSVTDAPEREEKHSVGHSHTEEAAANEGTPLSRSSSKNWSSHVGQGGEGAGHDEISSSMDHIMESLHGDAGSLCTCNCQVLRSVSPWSAGSAVEASIEQVCTTTRPYLCHCAARHPCSCRDRKLVDTCVRSATRMKHVHFCCRKGLCVSGYPLMFHDRPSCTPAPVHGWHYSITSLTYKCALLIKWHVSSAQEVQPSCLGHSWLMCMLGAFFAY